MEQSNTLKELSIICVLGKRKASELVGTNADVTDRRRAEDALRRSEAYLAESQKMSHTCSAAFNEAGMLYFSEEASRMFGF